ARSEKARNPGGDLSANSTQGSTVAGEGDMPTQHPVARYSSVQAYKPRRPPTTVEDKDACALYAAVRRDGRATHELIENGFVALQKMLHRAGNVDGEGDGCGALIDIPRAIWQEEVRNGGHAPK